MNLTNAPDRIAVEIKSNAYSVLAFLKSTHNIGIQVVWENEEATPAEILNSLGKDAGKIFELFSALTNFISSIDPTFEPKSPTQEFIINDDGTVVIVGD
jgi:hypothetical protein